MIGRTYDPKPGTPAKRQKPSTVIYVVRKDQVSKVISSSLNKSGIKNQNQTHLPSTQHKLTQRASSRMTDKHHSNRLTAFPPLRLPSLRLLDARHQIVANALPARKIHLPEARIPAISVSTVAHSVAWVSALLEESHIREPDRCAAEAAVGKEQRWLAAAGNAGERAEKLKRARGSVDVGAC